MTILFILWELGVLCMFPVVLFRIFCLFKKKCSWKKCPFRAKTPPPAFHFGGDLLDADCYKCPYPFDEEEEKELDETIRELTEMIEQLCGVQTHTNRLRKRKNASSPDKL